MEIKIEDFDNLTREVRALKMLTLNLRDAIEDGMYSNDIHNDAIQERHIDSGVITKNKITLTLDDINDGFVYGRVLETSITAGQILLSQVSGCLDDIADGTYAKALSTSLSSGAVLLAQADGTLDDITNGTTYGRVNVTNISSGSILLAQCTGDLDDVANGTTYGKVALTSISAGKIIIAGLDSGITDRMFASLNTKNAIEAWRHTSDITLIDGGDIYANSLTLVGTANDYDLDGIPETVTNKNFTTINQTKLGGVATGADVTGSNTAADTSLVNGLAASSIAGWAHATDTTKIDGGDIYTDTITVRKITLDSVGFLKTVGKDSYIDTTAGIWMGYYSGYYRLNIGYGSGTVGNFLQWTGTGLILRGKLYIGGGTNEDITFEDSGIRMYDMGGQVISLYKAGLKYLRLVLGSTYGQLATDGVLSLSGNNIEIAASAKFFYFYTTGSFRLPALTSAPTAHQGDLTCNASASDWFSGYITDWEHFQTSEGW